MPQDIELNAAYKTVEGTKDGAGDDVSAGQGSQGPTRGSKCPQLSYYTPNLDFGNLLVIFAIIVNTLLPVVNSMVIPEARQKAEPPSDHPGVAGAAAFNMHLFGGIGFAVCGLLQFSPLLRRKFPRFHRWVGYMFFVCQAVAIGGNLMLQYVFFYHLKGGLSSMLAVTFIYNPLWIYVSYRSVAAIIKGDVHTHRIFIIRAIGVSSGNFFVPAVADLIYGVMTAFNTYREAYGTAFWWCFTMGVLITELYIQYIYQEPKKIPVLHTSDGGDKAQIVDEALDGWTSVELVSKENDEEFYKLTFRTPTPVFCPPGTHISFRHPDSRWYNPLYRSYTPVNSKGCDIEFFIKRYETGKTSSWLTGLAIGDKVEAAGPAGPFHLRPHAHVLMLAAGTGITPFLSILNSKYGYKTKYTLVFYNQRKILEDDFQKIRDSGVNLDVTYVTNRKEFDLDAALRRQPGKGLGVRKFTGENASVLICGPAGFTESMLWASMRNGFNEKDVFAFGYSDH